MMNTISNQNEINHSKFFSSCKRKVAAVLVGAALVVLPLSLLGCGSSVESKANASEEKKTTTASAKWPEVAVSAQSVKTATAQTLGYTVTATIPLVRTTEVQETSPGHFAVTVKFNQPGMCHSSGSTWRVSYIEQSVFNLAASLFKHTGVDRLDVETYATPDTNIEDPEKFERVSRVVLERSRVNNVAWDAIKGYTVLRKVASEFWVTPQAMDDTGSGTQ